MILDASGNVLHHRYTAIPKSLGHLHISSNSKNASDAAIYAGNYGLPVRSSMLWQPYEQVSR